MRKLFAGLLGGSLLLWALKKQLPKAKQTILQGQTILITGASSGIGWVLAHNLVKLGYTVYGTVRKPEDAQGLLSAQIHPIQMDLGDEASIQQGFVDLAAQLDGQPLYALINNAGIGIPGPMALLPTSELRRQFEINLFGLHSLTQKALSLMQPKSKIIQISSIAGETTQPLTGAYSASKHALEALSDALRRELQIIQSGIEVIVVQPGSIETPIWEKVEHELDLSPYRGTPYQQLSEALYQRMKKATGTREKPEKVAAVIQKILQSSHNPPRYYISNDPLQEIIIPRAIPDQVLDWIFRRLLS